MKQSVKVLISGLVLLVGGMVFGFGGTIIGMIRSFNSVAASSGTASSEKLAEGIGNSLLSTAIGIPVSFIGLCLVVGGTIAYFVGRKKAVPETQQQKPA